MNTIDNVVVVVIDALRADRVGALGGATGLTPNIDAIADNGTAFTEVFTCASNTDPSMTSLLTGRYPLNTVYHHGKLVTSEEKSRIEAVTPIQSILSEAGWRTGTIGHPLDRWHSRGFDYYPQATDEVSQFHPMNLARQFYDIMDTTVPPIASLIRSLYNIRSRKMKPNIVMQDHDPTKLFDQVTSAPFFAVIHLMETHKPYLGTSEDFDNLVANREYPTETVEEFFSDRNVTDTQREAVVESLRSLGLDRPGEIIALYDAAVQYVDRKVGRLVEELKDRGMWDRTALFVTADHGESLFEHGIFLSHHGLYDEVLRVPLVCNIGDGEHVSELVQLIDIAPTVLDVLGVDGPEMDGESLLPAIRGDSEWSGRSRVFAEEAYYQRRFCVRTSQWKYIRHVPDPTIEAERGDSLQCGYCNTVHGSERQLFDLEVDNREYPNQVDDHPDVIEQLEDAYSEFKESLVEPTEIDRDIRYQEENDVLDRLEAIGYR